MVAIIYLDAVLVVACNCEQTLEFFPRLMELSSGQRKEQVATVIRNVLVQSPTLTTLIPQLTTIEIHPF